MYDTHGNMVTVEQIANAIANGTARIIWSRGFDRTNYSLNLDCEDFDTRGECYQMYEEQWTSVPNITQAIKAAS